VRPDAYPHDRFDDLAPDLRRVGAHRAENPRIHALPLLLWCLGAVIVLTLAGVFISMIGSGRVVLFPPPTPTPTPEAIVVPVIDTSYSVLVLNATGERGSATAVKDLLVAAGWPPESVLPSQAGSDFPTTTVYYPLPEDEAAALGVVDVIGGGSIEQSTAYLPVDDPGTTEVDESAVKQLTVVLGRDRVPGSAPAPSLS
jgi:hypothetical protein